MLSLDRKIITGVCFLVDAGSNCFMYTMNTGSFVTAFSWNPTKRETFAVKVVMELLQKKFF